MLIAVPSFKHFALKVSSKVPWPRAATFITRFQNHAASRLTTRHLTSAVLLGLVAWAASAANVALFFAVASEPSMTLLQSLLVFVVTTFGGAVPALPGGFGTYEASAVFALQQFHFSVPEALALAVALHVAQLILPLLATVYILAADRVGISELLRDLRSIRASRG
jgi:glycosyltransferase 2 family protein